MSDNRSEFWMDPQREDDPRARAPKGLSASASAERGDAFVAPAEVALVDLLDLGVGHCRWPFDMPEGTRFCGRRAVGPYCLEHAAIATVLSGARRWDGLGPSGPGLDASDG